MLLRSLSFEEKDSTFLQMSIVGEQNGHASVELRLLVRGTLKKLLLFEQCFFSFFSTK